MLISEKATISASADKVWNHLQTLHGAEEYPPIVTKSEVKDSGLSTQLELVILLWGVKIPNSRDFCETR
jgi:hypothetical protein